jgi:hypothetical protein
MANALIRKAVGSHGNPCDHLLTDLWHYCVIDRHRLVKVAIANLTGNCCKVTYKDIFQWYCPITDVVRQLTASQSTTVD